MDPNETLARIRDVLGNYRAGYWSGESAAEELAELIGGLDGWLSGGGFLPAAWEVFRHADSPTHQGGRRR
jgi:hypothetical protein